MIFLFFIKLLNIYCFTIIIVNNFLIIINILITIIISIVINTIFIIQLKIILIIIFISYSILNKIIIII